MVKDTENESTQDTEARILKAAEQEFMTKGFAGARTTSIAEAAGGDPRHVPLLFPDQAEAV